VERNEQLEKQVADLQEQLTAATLASVKGKGKGPAAAAGPSSTAAAAPCSQCAVLKAEVERQKQKKKEVKLKLEQAQATHTQQLLQLVSRAAPSSAAGPSVQQGTPAAAPKASAEASG
jgi:hypothetical protein